LNLLKTNALTELLNMPAGEITRPLIIQKLAKHPSSVDILAASSQPRDGALLNNVPQFEAILERMEFMARYIVVDLGNGLDTLAQTLLFRFNELLVVMEPFENSIQHSRTLLDDLVTLGFDKSQLHVAINYRVRSDTQLSVPQIQERIKFPIDVTFTPVPELLHQAARMQTMAYLVHEDGLTTQQYNTLVSKIELRTTKSVER
jgi:MinD-like ATPase involved in chromosome partitioning or flagellar assembly